MSETALTPAAKFKQVIHSKQVTEQMLASLADNNPQTVRRICAYVANAAMKTPQLFDCTKQSIVKAMVQCCAFGIEPNGWDAHILPYGKEATLVIDYKGFITLAQKSERISNVRAELVCQNDEFDYYNGRVSHRVNFFKPRGEIMGAYAVATYKDGTEQSAVLSKEEIDKVRNMSRARNAAAWSTHYGEMAKKGLALDTPIPTPNGWATMGELSVGDIVFDKDGKKTRVTSKSEVKNIDCFRVTLTNGESVVCDNEHRWLARIGNAKEYSVVTVNEIFSAKENGLHVTFPYHGALLTFTEDILLPVDPYLLGYWLGDGSQSRPNITCSKDDLPHVMKAIVSAGYRVGTIRTNDNRDRDCNAVTVGITNGMLIGLKALDLINNKHVPDCYLRASIQQRKALLAGLLDSDGHCDKERGRAIFGSTNKRLADSVYELACSLGEMPYRYEHIARGFGIETLFYEVGWKPTFNPFTLERKAERYQPRKLTPYMTVESVERVDSVPTQCIAVDSPSRTYLCGKGMIVTHNTAVRRLAKMLPLSHAAMAAIQHDDEANYTLEPAAPKAVAKQDPDALAAALAGGDITMDELPPPEEVVAMPATAAADADFAMEG